MPIFIRNWVLISRAKFLIKKVCVLEKLRTVTIFFSPTSHESIQDPYGDQQGDRSKYRCPDWCIDPVSLWNNKKPKYKYKELFWKKFTFNWFYF